MTEGATAGGHPPGRVVIYYVEGITNALGTCKFHVFQDCHQLKKKRVSRRAWGDQVSTGAIIGYPANPVEEPQN